MLNELRLADAIIRILDLCGYLKIDIDEAVKVKRIQDDPELAWGWHCNIACPIMDAGVDHKTANKIAAAVMKSLFEIDITTYINYVNLMSNK